ncbi:MAG: type VI secretion system baseplate subunit TssG [Pseudomonadota bacterium]
MTPVRDPVTPQRQKATKLGLFAVLRRLERQNPSKPRIGRNSRLADEIAALGQEPSLEFSVSDLSDFEQSPHGTSRIRSNVLGFFGPQGALPLNTTEEALRWVEIGNDRSFVHFVDVFAARFLQLFFRAWSDSHAISQFDHPDRDRFGAYVSALSGVSTPAFRNRDGIPDISRTHLVSLHAARVRSGVRLRQLIELYLGAQVTVVEHVPAWVEFEVEDRSRMGLGASTLGQDLALGSRMRSVNDRVRLDIRARTLAEYRSYLPGERRHSQLQDLVAWYLGLSMEVGVTLSLPASEVPPAALGQTTELGWMAAMAPDTEAGGHVQVAEYGLEAV